MFLFCFCFVSFRVITIIILFILFHYWIIYYNKYTFTLYCIPVLPIYINKEKKKKTFFIITKLIPLKSSNFLMVFVILEHTVCFRCYISVQWFHGTYTCTWYEDVHVNFKLHEFSNFARIQKIDLITFYNNIIIKSI